MNYRSRRESTPSPPSGHPLYDAFHEGRMAPSPETQALSNSWPDARGKAAPTRGKKFGRPSTATLDKPKVQFCILCLKSIFYLLFTIIKPNKTEEDEFI